jgi:hypothetical protein
VSVPAVVPHLIGRDAATHAPTMNGELLEFIDIVSRISQIPQRTYPPGSSNIRLDPGDLPSDTSISCLMSATKRESLLIHNAMHAELVNFSSGIQPPQLITILKSYLDKDIVTAPSSCRESRGKFFRLTSYHFGKKYLYQL